MMAASVGAVTEEGSVASPEPGRQTLLRQALVRCGAAWSDAQEVRDCAELLLQGGEPEAARILFEALSIEGGYADARLREQIALAGRTGLWEARDWPEPAETVGEARFAMDEAVDALRGLMAVATNAPPPSAPASAESFSDPEFVSALCAALRGDVGQLSVLLERARTRMLTASPIVLGDLIQSGAIVDLAAAVACNRVRRFLILNQDLAYAPLGAPALLFAAARLEEGVLAPYLRNVPLLIRSADDVIGLARLASGEEDGERIGRWCVLLATHLDEDDRIALAHALADLGMAGALRQLLDAAVRRGEDRGLYWAIRDGALDLGETAIAADAQRAILPFERKSTVELVVLAEILASAGDMVDAAATLGWTLLLHPHDRPARRRMAALIRGRFGRFVVRRGYGTSPLRFARRRAAFGQA